jgi:hypothetical protein
MQTKELKIIASKYRKLAGSVYDEEKANKYELFADYIEENDYRFEDDDYETEEDILNDFNEEAAEIEAQWDDMFPEGDDDDSITDFLTK